MRIKAPNGFISVSDAHREPDQLLPTALWDAARFAKANKCVLVLNGDMLDLIIWGYKSYATFHSGETLWILPSWTDTYYVLGNHEGRIQWLRRLFKGSKVHICKSLDIDVNGVKWHVEHGDRYSLDWGHLKWLYDAVAFAFLAVAPKLWLKLMTPWRPGALKPSPGTESEKYNHLTGITWRNAWNDSLHRHANITHGHTHLAWAGTFMGIYDSGDIRDGSAVIVGPEGVGDIKWFTSPAGS